MIERRARPVEEEEEDNTLSLAQMEAQLKPEALGAFCEDHQPVQASSRRSSSSV
jgi:hypothetical protein